MTITAAQLILLGVCGGTLGTSALFIWLGTKEDPTQQILDKQTETIQQIATLQTKVDAEKIQIQKNLTNQDLLEIPCSASWMETNSDLLCREMFCRMQTREGAAASQDECEQIANVANSITIMKECKKLDLEQDKCASIVYRRK